MLMDLGAGVYSRQYFAKDTRYGILECSSRGHSVPIVGGRLQVFGKSFAARDVKYEDGVFSMDIAGAYECPGLESIRRSFTLGDDTVILTDEFDYSGDGEIVERIVTLFEPCVGDGVVTVEDVEVKFDPTECSVSVGSEVSEHGHTCYFIDFMLRDGVRRFSCEMK